MTRPHFRSSVPLDFVSILEAIYRVEQSREEWLRGVLVAAHPFLDLGGGVNGVLYRLEATSRVTLEAIDGVGVPAGSREFGITLHEDPRATAQIHAGYSQWPLCGTFQQILREPSHVRAIVDSGYESFGFRDQLFLNAREASGVGCCIYVPSPEIVQLAPSRWTTLRRIATHLATARRLQLRLSLDSVRPLAPVATTLESERRHVLERANELTSHCASSLSKREHQVVSLAAVGRSNKVIAYELGLAHSTVRVLMQRAAEKLGVRSRTELIHRFAGMPRESMSSALDREGSYKRSARRQLG